jgi:uncharacterized membrane protein YfcA
MFEAPLHWLPMLGALLGAGALGGLLAGLLGVGGGIVIVPVLDAALNLAGVSPDASLHVAVATSMATIIPTSISSSRSHAQRGSVDAGIVKRWSVPIVLGALAGALAASPLPWRSRWCCRSITSCCAGRFPADRPEPRSRRPSARSPQ